MLLSRMIMLIGAHAKGGLALPASQSITSTNVSGATVTARLLIDEDGGFRRYAESSGSGSTIDFGAWWDSHPDAGNPGDNYHVKITALGTNRMIGTDMAHDTWESIVTDRIAYFSKPGQPGLHLDATTYTVAFSSDGGTTTDGSYTLTVHLTNETP